MTRDEYRAGILALGLNQTTAAKALGFGERTSRRYAAQGVPEKHSAWVQNKMADYAAKEAGWAEQFALSKTGEKEDD